MKKYARLFQLTGFRVSIVAAIAGKFQPAMYTLSLLMLASSELSYAMATLVVSGASFGAVTTPVRGRLLDKYSYAVVLWPLLLLHILAIALFVAEIKSGAAPLVLFGLAVWGSVVLPPIGTVTRVIWRRIAPDDLRPTALALDAVLTDCGFIAGPLLVVLLAGAVSPGTPLMICVALMVVAVPLALSAAGPKSDDSAARPRDWAGPLRSAQVRWVVLVALLFFFAFTILELTLASYGPSDGISTVGASLLSTVAIASVVGGIVLGSLSDRRQSRLMRPSMMLFGLAAAGALLIGAVRLDTALVFVACVLAGLFLGPCFASIYGAAGDSAPPAHEAETQSWVAGAMMLGGALGTAIAGWTVQQGGTAGSIGLIVVGWVLAGMCGLRIVRPSAPPGYPIPEG